jgi:four helix bundle protein
MGSYRNLKVWERAHRLTLEVYSATKTFPRDEMFGLTSQLRRSASSIPANIAEGCGRNGDTELARFLTIAMGSASELDYYLLLSRDLGYLLQPRYDHLATETQGVAKMLATFIDRLRHPSGIREPTEDGW